MYPWILIESLVEGRCLLSFSYQSLGREIVRCRWGNLNIPHLNTKQTLNKHIKLQFQLNYIILTCSWWKLKADVFIEVIHNSHNINAEIFWTHYSLPKQEEDSRINTCLANSPWQDEGKQQKWLLEKLTVHRMMYPGINNIIKLNISICSCLSRVT